MKQALGMNIAGRVMLTLSRVGANDAGQLRTYIDAVGAAVDQQLRLLGDAGFDQVESIIDRQAALLEQALRNRARDAVEIAPELPPVAAETRPAEVQSETKTETDAEATVEEAPSKRAARQASGYVPAPRSMEQKLHDEREPIQKLLAEDCVSAGLIDKKRAAKMISQMSGKTSEAAELEIVESLREVLQQQVKKFIRKSKGGPWATPRQQNDLHQDIHRATTIRSVLMLTRQIIKEREVWEKENGRVGILGLFASRR